VQQDWSGLRTLVRVVRKRCAAEKETRKTPGFLGSLSGSDGRLGRTVRGHWSIENGLHCPLDVTIRVVDCRIRFGHGPANFATLRDTAMNLLISQPKGRVTVRGRRKIAGWTEGNPCPRVCTARDEDAAEQAMNAQHPNTSTPASSEEYLRQVLTSTEPAEACG
jgi:predicted transposase YbfD/YdcC